MTEYTFVPKLNRSLILFLTLILVLATLLASRPLAWSTPVASAGPTIAPDYIKLPLSFVPNAGQTDPNVRFQAQGMNGTFFFTPGEVVLSLPALPANDQQAAPPGIHSSPAVHRSPSVVHLRFEGANPTPEVTGLEPLPGIVNYLTGNDPAQWRTNLPTYVGISYRQLYPGIDLRYEGAAGILKSTYTVAAGADPSRIRWRYDGATSVRVDEASGDLLINLPTSTDKQTSGEAEQTLSRSKEEGRNLQSAIQNTCTAGRRPDRRQCPKSEIVERAPLAWQTIAGRRIPVSVRYTLLDHQGRPIPIQNPKPALSEVEGSKIQNPIIGFRLGDYDPARPLTLDPALDYSTYLGGSGSDQGRDIAVDASGNAYVTGSAASSNFPTVNPFQAANAGSSDAFVAKLNPDGSALLYATYLGGSAVDYGWGIAVDAAGNAYVTGATASSDFPMANPFQGANRGRDDAFIAKLNPTGSALLYATYLGGIFDDFGYSIAVDTSGNALVTGLTTSSNFPTVNPLQPALDGSSDAFVVKVNPAGSSLAYATYLGGDEVEAGYGIAVDASGNAYVTGYTHALDFPTVNPLQPAFGGYWDAFVTKVNPAGSALVYSTFLGGWWYDYGYDIAVDTSGNAYVTGFTTSSDFPTANPLQPVAGGGPFDAFVAKLNPAGSAFVYSTYLGGGAVDNGWGIAADPSGNAYVTGATASSDFPTANPLQAANAGGLSDAFVSKLNPAGSAFVYSTYLGGGGDDHGLGIAADSSGSAYVTGSTTSSNFPTANPFQAANAGGLSDAFVTKIASTGASGATLTVEKVLVPATDGGKFNLQIDGGDVAIGIGHGGGSGAVAVGVGSHTAGETAAAGTNLADYVTVIGGDCSTAGSITLVAGQHATCTITNTRRPALTVDKVASADVANVGQTITYTYTVTNLGVATLTGVSASDDPLGPIDLDATTLTSGESAGGVATYTVQMSNLPGPLTNTVTVSGTPPAGPVVTAADQISVAVVTSSITIVKEASGVHDFAFTGDLGDFTLTTAGAQNFKEFPNQFPGDYTVAEDPASFPDPFWVLLNVTCRDRDGQPVPVTIDQNAPAATIHLGTGQHLTCTFLNQRASAGEQYYTYLPLIYKQNTVRQADICVVDLDGVGTIEEGTKWFATVTLTMQNDGIPVAGVDVTFTWTPGESNTCTTDGAGQCTINSETIEDTGITSINFTIDNVNGPNYDQTANIDPDGDSDGTTITVNRP